jgi:glutathione S-transferase
MSLVAQLLKESDLDYRYERVSPFIGDTITEAHRARNPLGKIPSLCDMDGTVVSESQAICRYLARVYPSAATFYPVGDVQLCARADALNDYLSFSVSGPFFNWFVVSGYYPKAFGFNTEDESKVFGDWSFLMLKGALMRLTQSAEFSPYLLGNKPYLPDFHLFHVLELSKTFSVLFDNPFMNLMLGDQCLEQFYEVMSAREATQEILSLQAAEYPATRTEILEQFGATYGKLLKPARDALTTMFGHAV